MNRGFKLLIPFDDFFDNLWSKLFPVDNFVRNNLHIASRSVGFIYMPSM